MEVTKKNVFSGLSESDNEGFIAVFRFFPVSRRLRVTRHFQNPNDLVVQLFSYALREKIFPKISLSFPPILFEIIEDNFLAPTNN